VGSAHLAWSSWWPLRLAQQAGVLVELLPEAARRLLAHEPLADGRSIARAARALRAGPGAG
jgi:uncharacterized membrane protein YccC